MAWHWSYTSYGLKNIHDQIHALPRESLLDIHAEIMTSRQLHGANPNDDGTDELFDEAQYKRNRQVCLNMQDEDLADAISEFASEQSLCGPGGHRAFVCPYNDCHTVPLDPVNPEESE